MPALTPREIAGLEKDPATSAEMLYQFAPATFSAVVSLYCEAEADDAPPGRHVETADIRGGVL